MHKCWKVVIADDNERARNGLRAWLAMRQEIEIVGEVADGQAAVQMVRERQPDVVLMDARMPHMDGLVATRQIKARWPEVRVVVAAGADRFLSKGCPIHELLEALKAPGYDQ